MFPVCICAHMFQAGRRRSHCRNGSVSGFSGVAGRKTHRSPDREQSFRCRPRPECHGEHIPVRPGRQTEQCSAALVFRQQR